MSDMISKDMTFGEVIKKFPKSAQIMAGYGLHCIGCHIAVSETIAEGAQAHGFDNDTLNNLIKDLNEKAV